MPTNYEIPEDFRRKLEKMAKDDYKAYSNFMHANSENKNKYLRRLAKFENEAVRKRIMSELIDEIRQEFSEK